MIKRIEVNEQALDKFIKNLRIVDLGEKGAYIDRGYHLIQQEKNEVKDDPYISENTYLYTLSSIETGKTSKGYSKYILCFDILKLIDDRYCVIGEITEHIRKDEKFLSENNWLVERLDNIVNSLNGGNFKGISDLKACVGKVGLCSISHRRNKYRRRITENYISKYISKEDQEKSLLKYGIYPFIFTDYEIVEDVWGRLKCFNIKLSILGPESNTKDNILAEITEKLYVTENSIYRLSDFFTTLGSEYSPEYEYEYDTGAESPTKEEVAKELDLVIGKKGKCELSTDCFLGFDKNTVSHYLY